MTLDEARAAIGRKAVYHPGRGWPLAGDPSRPEEGVITEVRGEYVFVRYGGDVTAKATRPEDLGFIS